MLPWLGDKRADTQVKTRSHLQHRAVIRRRCVCHVRRAEVDVGGHRPVRYGVTHAVPRVGDGTAATVSAQHRCKNKDVRVRAAHPAGREVGAGRVAVRRAQHVGRDIGGRKRGRPWAASVDLVFCASARIRVPATASSLRVLGRNASEIGRANARKIGVRLSFPSRDFSWGPVPERRDCRPPGTESSGETGGRSACPA